MQRRDYLDQAQAAKIIQSAPDGFTPEEIKRRHIQHCTQADPAYGAGVAKALGLD